MAPATSTQGLVIDLLVRKIQGLNVVIDGQPVPVFDGSNGPSNENNFVVVMGDEDEPSTQGQQEWAALGSRARYENYDVFIGAFSYCGGDDSTGMDDASDAQALARTNVTTISAAIESALLADINLATQNGGTAPIIWSEIQGSSLTQLPPDDDSGMGRYIGWKFRVHIYNRLSGG